MRLLPALFAALAQPVIHVGAQPTGLAYGAGSLWSANSGAGTVSRVDIAHRRVEKTIRVGMQPASSACAAGPAWARALTHTTLSTTHPWTHPTTAHSRTAPPAGRSEPDAGRAAGAVQVAGAE